MILILNGASSSGKTALARALQLRWDGPLLHLGTDAMIGMLPASLVGMKSTARAGVEFFEDADERGAVVRARNGPVARKLEASFARAAAGLAEDGHDLVIDLVLFDPASARTWARAVRHLPTCLIGVRCDLAVLEARELARGDRFANLARSQHGVVHRSASFYDCTVDTTSTGPHELAAAIVEFVSANPDPRGVSQLCAQSGAADAAS